MAKVESLSPEVATLRRRIAPSIGLIVLFVTIVKTLIAFRKRRITLGAQAEAVDSGTLCGKLVFTLFEALTEVEPDLGRERTRLAAQRTCKQRGAPVAVP